MRLGTIDDLEIIVPMAMKFISQVAYKEHCTEEYVRAFVTAVLEAPNTEKVIILDDDKGFIVGLTSPFPFGPGTVATEMGLWVEEEHRKTSVAKELIDAFEYWAKATGCLMTIMICLDDKVGEYYKKRGYKLTEYAYMKDI